MSPEDSVRVRHMINAAETALRFIEKRSRKDLDEDDMLVRAVEIIGEAASKVSPSARAEAGEVPWSKIVGMRNRVVHAYFDVDLDILWSTVTEALPLLLAQLRPTAG